MTTNRMMAGASRFAHFAGLTRASRRAAEDDEDEQGKRSRRAADDDGEEGDEDEPKGKRSRRAADDDGDEGDEGTKGKRSRRAADDGDEGDEDEPKGKRSRRAADDDGDEGDEDEPKGKRSRRAADDDGDEEDDEKDEMSGRSAKASARLREQSRIASILGHSAAANNLQLAVSLACETRMTRREAITVLRGQARRADRDDDDRRAQNPHAREDRARRNANLDDGGRELSAPQQVNSSWSAAFQKAGIKTR